MPARAACTAVAPWPVTTQTGDSPAMRAAATTLRTMGSPSTGSTCLTPPMRVAMPAAKTTAATGAPADTRRGLRRPAGPRQGAVRRRGLPPLALPGGFALRLAHGSLALPPVHRFRPRLRRAGARPLPDTGAAANF